MAVSRAAQPDQRRLRARQAAVYLLIFGALSVILATVTDLTMAEGEALWVIRDDLAWQVAPGDVARNLLDNVDSLWARAQDQPQPPLYFALLDSWEILAGESIIALRWPSILLAMLATAILAKTATRVVPVRLPDALLLTALVALMFAAQVYTYALLTFLAAVAWSVLVSWQLTGKRRFGVLYALALTGAFYTHHVAAPLVIWHALTLWWLRGRGGKPIWRMWIAAVAFAGITLAPWLILFQQRDLDFLFTPQSLTGLLAVFAPVLPLLYGVSVFSRAGLERTKPGRITPNAARLTAVLAGITIPLYMIFATGPANKTWASSIARLNDRDPFTPLIYAVDDRHPLTHYDRLPETQWRKGITIDVGWREQSEDEIAALLEKLETDDMWIMVPYESDLSDWLADHWHANAGSDGAMVMHHSTHDMTIRAYMSLFSDF